MSTEWAGAFKVRSTDLTGRARVRSGWFGQLILQVEILTTVYSACPPPPGTDAGEWRTRQQSRGTVHLSWRDARWDDIYAGISLDLMQPTVLHHIRK